MERKVEGVGVMTDKEINPRMEDSEVCDTLGVSVKGSVQGRYKEYAMLWCSLSQEILDKTLECLAYLWSDA